MAEPRVPLDKANKRVVNAAMAWLRWMEKNNTAKAWLTERTWPEDSAIPKLLRATDALRKARRAR